MCAQRLDGSIRMLLLLLVDYCRSDANDDDGDDRAASIHGHVTPLLDCQLLDGRQSSRHALALALIHRRVVVVPTVAALPLMPLVETSTLRHDEYRAH